MKAHAVPPAASSVPIEFENLPGVFRGLFESLPDAAVVLDRDQRVVAANRRYF